MASPPTPEAEAKRLAALQRFHVLDTLPEPALDELTELAAEICNAPIALIAFLDEHRQWFKARVGFSDSGTPRELSFCTHALRYPNVFIVPDATRDPRFAENPYVVGDPRVRFYAGAPLLTSDGLALGTLCVMDRVPRNLSELQQRALVVLGRQVMAHLEMNRQARGLIESESRYRLTLESLREGGQLIGFDWRYLYLNEAAARHNRRPNAELLGRTMMEMWPGIEGSHVYAVLKKCMDERVALNEETEFQFLDGSKGWFDVRCQPAPEGIFVLSIDITDRKHSEQQILHLNRILNTLSSINHCIVHEKETRAVLESACRIATEKGDFPLAWIGMQGPHGGLRIQAQSGADIVTLDLLNRLIVAEPPAGCTFTKSALELGRIAVCNDIAQLSPDVLWREPALRRGYHALASLPLVKRGRTIGVFNLYAREAGFFDAQEISLLTELAMDISFALEVRQLDEERQVASRAAEEKNEILQKVFDRAPVMIWFIDTDGRISMANNEFQNTLGWTLPEIRDHPDFLAELYPDPDYRRYVLDFIRKGDGVFAEFRTCIRNGSPITTSFANVLLSDGTSIGIGMDITSRKRAEQALKESETRFRQVVENIREVFWIVDAQLRILYVSPAYELIWGRSPASLYESPRTWLDAVHPEDRDRVEQAEARQAEGGYDITYRIVRPDGSIRWIHDRAFVVRNEAGAIESIVGTAIDISQQRDIEDRYLRSQKMEAIGQLAGGVAHDFNNILAAMMLQAELAGTPEGLPKETREMLLEIRASAERAARLTRQLLTFSRRQVLQPRLLDVNEIVTGMVSMLQRLVGEDVTIQLNLHSRPLITRADPGTMEQVLMNLVVNARDAMPDGGRLTIETAERESASETVYGASVASSGRKAVLRVSDTGVGIAPEHMKHIFEPFFTTKEPGKGTGLGLPTVFGIVRQHSGSIQVSSELGRGTTFEILLPAEVAGEGAEVQVAASERPRRGSETLLVVEDEAPIRKLTRIILEQNGYTVFVAADGVEALDLWEKNSGNFHLLLTDIVMPAGISGRDLAKRLRERNPALRVIFTSGYSPEVAGRDLTLQPGLNFIQKPSSPQELLETVRRCLDS